MRRMLLVGFFIISLFNLMVFFPKTIMKSNSGGGPFLIQGDYIKHLSDTSQDNVKEGNLGNGHSQA